jgi:hypothetical protein
LKNEEEERERANDYFVPKSTYREIRFVSLSLSIWLSARIRNGAGFRSVKDNSCDFLTNLMEKKKIYIDGFIEDNG